MNTIWFAMQKEINEEILLLHVNTLTPVRRLIWLDSNETYDSGDKEIIFGERKTGKGQFKNHYQLFFREYRGAISLRTKIDWLKQLALLHETDLLIPDEEIDPSIFILVDSYGNASSVEVDVSLYDENNELRISGICQTSFGGFATESILNDKQENTLLKELKKLIPKCKIVSYEPGLLPYDFNKNKKDFPSIQFYNHLYLITQTGDIEWRSKDEKSQTLLDLMHLFYTQTRINVCLFLPNSVTIENIPGGSDSEAFCVLITNRGTEKIIYKPRKKYW